MWDNRKLGGRTVKGPRPENQAESTKDTAKVT